MKQSYHALAALVLGGLPSASAADDGCPDDPAAALSAFQEAARAGEQAFAQMNLDGLNEAGEAAQAAVPCLTEPIPVKVAADFHRLRALRAFTANDSSLVLAEFHAARRLMPGYVVPESVAPPGHPLQQLYEFSTGADEGELEIAVPPMGGRVFVDGVASAPRPRATSSVVQVYREDGSFLESRFLAPGEATPAWGLRPEEALKRERRHQVLLGAGGLLAAASASTYLASRLGRSRFDEATNVNEIMDLRNVTNTAYWVSVGTGVGALGVGAVAIATW